MTLNKPKIPNIPEEKRTPEVVLLLEVLHQQNEIIQAMRDEIARLKGHKTKPDIRPSTLEKNNKEDSSDKDKEKKKRPGSQKKKKKLVIHETIIVPPDNVPAGSVPKGYEDFIVQDILIKPHTTKYRLQRWLCPDGSSLTAKLPENGQQGHFGPTLIRFILYQYYHALTTQPLILEMVQEFGVDISSGKINSIIIEGKDQFHEEKATILKVGLEVSSYIQADDTGARHKGKNGFCTHIGNQLFAWFNTTSSKSRINFLESLRTDKHDYVINEIALDYMRSQKLPKSPIAALRKHPIQHFEDHISWDLHLKSLGITRQHHIRIATEGALLGSLINHGMRPGLVVLSDDAGQFNILKHALCWIHAERNIRKVLPFKEDDGKALDIVLDQIWEFYQELKAYKISPTSLQKAELNEKFDRIFTQKTCFTGLNLALKRLYANKAELLLVLEHPDIPLHNNASEGDIREYVKRRKISGTTRSDQGRRCRDTFASLKKTCRKLGISFWAYLKDRLTGAQEIAPLSEIIRERAAEIQ